MKGAETKKMRVELKELKKKLAFLVAFFWMLISWEYFRKWSDRVILRLFTRESRRAAYVRL